MTTGITREYCVKSNSHHTFKQYSLFPLKAGNTAILLSVVKSNLKVAHLEVEGSFLS